MNQRILRFKMSDRLIFGNGSVKELAELIRGSGWTRPLIVTDPGIVEAGVCDPLIESLREIGASVTTYTNVEPDPRIELTVECAVAARAGECDVLVGVGGGSSLDIAKVTSILLTNPGEVNSFFGIDKVPRRGLPTILIPTTAGTGSEVTPIAVLSDTKEHLKKGIVSDAPYAAVAIVDPELCASMPARVTAYTGMDALTHAVEAYTNKHAQPFVDTFALEAIRLIGSSLRHAVAEVNPSARYNMSLGSLYGGLCLGSVNTAAVHALAYPLGGTFNLPHGVANSLLLPYVMAFNMSANARKFGDIARALGVDTTGMSDNKAAGMAVDATRQLAEDTGISLRMRDFDIPEGSIPAMAEGAMKVTRLLNNNPREVTLKDAIAIYRDAH